MGAGRQASCVWLLGRGLMGHLSEFVGRELSVEPSDASNTQKDRILHFLTKNITQNQRLMEPTTCSGRMHHRLHLRSVVVSFPVGATRRIILQAHHQVNVLLFLSILVSLEVPSNSLRDTTWVASEALPWWNGWEGATLHRYKLVGVHPT